ncbi:ATP-dependent helicase/deoxyribonuclease subunit B [Apilactobacillus kunkeei]|uniref:PD-(D/E)XK nuclease family protein n=1 Tax=Apilactobacillus kunkeei TaxID=148814 RepID=UPI00200ABD78|nr:PD-(D/E)XK nuclease family protein [Apilactobacillus kunkeei]MCK8629432.1 PD-(D/E)XK nuclease family protein [Apilactobacillus kunkeei]CAI2696850.1 ATP-dependent helicase/deoxyribonuclease subunit B [Apilactobacillus kunkeei]CAI2697880.1 ATP-dependent helicase/deoxyribonuclease subunit B [Apilactobacillus kunkeei]
MSLQFILGTASYDHEAVIVDSLKESINNHPDDEFFYLVPNHIKFESEVQALKDLNTDNEPIYAESKFQTFSITRLVWYYMKNNQEYQKTRLSDSGISMLIYQILIDHQDELTVFRGETGQPGFIQKLAQQISEMQSGQISADNLEKIVDNNDKLNAGLRDKMHDFIIIYRAFEEQTQGIYLYKSDVLNLFCRFIENDELDLSHSHFYFNGFNQFTAQEAKLVELLIKRSAGVTIGLNLDRKYPDELPQGPNLFFQSAKWYNRFYNIARATNVPVLVDKMAKNLRVSDDLHKLDTYWSQSTGLGDIDKSELSNPDSIQVYRADSPFAEVENIAVKIRQMVAHGGYKYSDFLILTRHLDKYQNVINPVFKMLDVPAFNDVSKSMKDHPLVELIDALFSLENGSRKYQYQDVMRLLKTELMVPGDGNGNFMDSEEYRQYVALTENLVLKNGYEGSRWTQKEDWQYAWLSESDFGVQADRIRNISEKINVIRHFIGENFPPFFKKLRNAKNGQDAAAILFQFLVDMGVVRRLKQWRNDSIDNDNLIDAAQPEQVWQTFTNLLDDYVSILGNREFNADDFLNLLQSGFAGANYSQIPSTLDQVAISESGIVQMNNRKVVFMMGATDEVMPDKITNEALFSDADRDDLRDFFDDDQYLRETSENQMANDPFLNYLAFLSGSEKLIFSYSLGDSDESSVAISPYVSRIAEHFGIDIQHISSHPTSDAKDVYEYVGTYRSTLRHLVQASQDAKVKNSNLAPAWQYIYNKLNQNLNYRDLTNKLLGGLDYNNTPTQLLPEIVTGLYGDKINTSISKLEQFYSNPYEYFLRYGLKLKERDVFDLSPASTGQFYHESMDHLMRIVNSEHIDLENLDKQAINDLVDTVVAKMLEDPNDFQYTILSSSSRMNYIKNQLIKTVKHTIETIQKQSKYTPMRAKKTEISFGQVGHKDDLQPLSFELPKSNELTTAKLVNVRGRIDRIDSMNVDGKNYLGIVDYKSSERKLDFSRVYDGTSMQMMTYIDVLAHNLGIIDEEEKAALAGAVYMHIYNPKYTKDDLKKSFEEAVLSKQKYQGILVNDGELLDKIDKTIADDKYGSSNVYPLRKKKDGSFYKSSPIVQPEDLDLLLSHNEDLIKKAGLEIFTGNIDLKPARFGQNQDAMQFTPYRSIMQFDPLLNENNYRDVPNYSLEEVLKMLRGDNQ